jgi:hypothetical protein
MVVAREHMEALNTSEGAEILSICAELVFHLVNEPFELILVIG